MPAPIPESIKSKVIEMWFLGHSRDSTASANGISHGAVTNIIKEREDAIGRDVMRGLRELGVLLKREGLSPAQCAIGFRIIKIFADQGVDREAAEHFISDTYKECSRLGITPNNVITHIEDLVKFSKEESVRLPEIQQYIDRKTIQKNELEDGIEQLNNRIVTLAEKKSELEKSCDMISGQIRKLEHEMKSYISFKQELENYGISLTYDIPKLASTVKTIAQYGYDPQRILGEFQNMQYHQDKLRALEIAVNEKRKEFEKLDTQNSSLLQAISFHSNKLEIYNELASMGFNIEKLRGLYDVISNIPASNQISNLTAVDKFFKDIETQYDAKLGFELEKDRLAKEIQELKEEHKKQLESLRDQPFIGPTIAELLRRGLTEDDIQQFGKLLLNLSEGPHSLKRFVLVMIDAIRARANSRTRTAIDEKTIEILELAKEQLSRLDSS
jgi:hypothetical protein